MIYPVRARRRQTTYIRLGLVAACNLSLACNLSPVFQLVVKVVVKRLVTLKDRRPLCLHCSRLPWLLPPPRSWPQPSRPPYLRVISRVGQARARARGLGRSRSQCGSGSTLLVMVGQSNRSNWDRAQMVQVLPVLAAPGTGS